MATAPALLSSLPPSRGSGEAHDLRRGCRRVDGEIVFGLRLRRQSAVMVEKHLVAGLVPQQARGLQRVAVQGVMVRAERMTHGVVLPSRMPHAFLIFHSESSEALQLPEPLLVVVGMVVPRHLSGAVGNEREPEHGVGCQCGKPPATVASPVIGHGDAEMLSTPTSFERSSATGM